LWKFLFLLFSLIFQFHKILHQLLLLNFERCNLILLNSEIFSGLFRMDTYCHRFVLSVSLLSVILIHFRINLLKIVLIQVFIFRLISVLKLVKVWSRPVCRFLPYRKTFCFFHFISNILIILIPQFFSTSLIMLRLFFHW